jgi:DNA polymerase
LQREDVYICNVLKCRPPSNRDPLPAEIEACRDYLDEQIDLIDPLVIVTLGRFSMARFFPGQSISKIHGRARQTAGRYYVPMYHPAAALHQGSLRGTMLADFHRLGQLLTEVRPTTAPAAAASQRSLFDDVLAIVSTPREAEPVAAVLDAARPLPGQIRLFD